MEVTLMQFLAKKSSHPLPRETWDGSPQIYVTRDVDIVLGNYIKDLRTIAVYGGAGQGKTCLIRNTLHSMNIPEVYISCNFHWSLANLYGAICKAAGFAYVTIAKTVDTSGAGITAGIKKKFDDYEAELGASLSGSTSTETQYQPLEFSVSETNDIIQALNTFDGYIVLDNFQYLSRQTTRDFLSKLKYFHDNHIHFIISGIWTDTTDILRYNNNLRDIFYHLNIGRWKKEDMHKILNVFCQRYNIAIDESDSDALITATYNNPGRLQHILFDSYYKRALQHPSNTVGRLSVDPSSFPDADYKDILTQFSKGFDRTSLDLYRWFVYVVLATDETIVKNGIPFSHIAKVIREKHPKSSEKKPILDYYIARALDYIVPLQINKGIQPFLFYYNTKESKLMITDYDFLPWRNNPANRSTLLTALNLPEEAPDE